MYQKKKSKIPVIQYPRPPAHYQWGDNGLQPSSAGPAAETCPGRTFLNSEAPTPTHLRQKALHRAKGTILLGIEVADKSQVVV